MDSMVALCKKCDREIEHEVVDIKEGENCWLVITVKCTECGSVQEIHLYS